MLGLRDDQAYINAGLLVFNNKIWNDKGLVEQCLAILAERHFKRHDQDMINFICKGKIYYLDAEWNIYCKLHRSDGGGGQRLRQGKKRLRSIILSVQ